MSVRLTAKGDRFLNDFLPGYFKAIAGLMTPLSESERKTLVRLLGKVQQHIATLRSETTAQPASA
jgi:DNA-binding MarR family transcriptional regulator